MENDQYLTFHKWFENHVKNVIVSEEVKWLAKGPNNVARRFLASVINENKFIIEGCERQTQNFGVMVTSSTIRFKNKEDENPEVENVTYYGVLKDIIELDYYGHSKFVLFKCDWFESKQDHFGLTLVNFAKLIYKSDPFVFATQVQQVYYTEDPTNNWQVVTKTTPRDLFDVYEDLENDEMKNYLEDKLKSSFFHQSMIDEDEDEDVSWFRDDVPGTTIDTSAMDNH